MTREEAIELLVELRICKDDCSVCKLRHLDGDTHCHHEKALNLAIKALEQQLRDCKTCKHSDKGNCAYTEECHECMWESKYEQQPSEDCISRKAVLKIFDEACYIDDDWYVMREKIEKLPSVKQTRPKGKWIILDECANEGVYCSECHKTVFKLEFSPTMKWRNFKYCPNCGADMRGDSE